MEITPGIRRLGNGLINSYLVEEGREVTIIDAGAPAYWSLIPGELAAMGRTLEDVRAVVLTHGHTDHIGFAERMRRERGVPVSVHERDAALARREVPNSVRMVGPKRLGAAVGFMLFAARNGLLRVKALAEVATFGDGATLDVPGAPRVIHVPGHTAGSAALYVTAARALFVGDAIATQSVLSGSTGPQLNPFVTDEAQALESLDRLAGVDAAFVLPGHGQPWTGGIEEAIRRVRAAPYGVRGGGRR